MDFCDIFSGFRVAANAKKLKNGYFCSDISPKNLFNEKIISVIYRDVCGIFCTSRSR